MGRRFDRRHPAPVRLKRTAENWLEEFRTMMRRLAVRRESAGLFALNLGILLACWALFQAQRTLAQEPAPAASAAPAAPAVPAAAQEAVPANAAAPDDEAAQAVPPVYAHWAEDLAAWRAAREREIGAPDGWLTLVGLEWLQPGVNSIGAAQDNQIRVHAQAPDHIGLLTVNRSEELTSELQSLRHLV